MTTHEIISATENPCGGVSLTIRWSNGTTTTQYYGSEAAKALGWKRPDPQPVDPAWMVEVAKDALEQAASPTFAISVVPLAFRLALSRGHVVLAPVMPSEEEMLAAAVEDAAQANERWGNTRWAHSARDRRHDSSYDVQSALQARRNVYASLGAVRAVSSGPVVPEVDLTNHFRMAWTYGYEASRTIISNVIQGVEMNSAYYDEMREKDVSAILESLKSGEA